MRISNNVLHSKLFTDSARLMRPTCHTSCDLVTARHWQTLADSARQCKTLMD